MLRAEQIRLVSDASYHGNLLRTRCPLERSNSKTYLLWLMVHRSSFLASWGLFLCLIQWNLLIFSTKKKIRARLAGIHWKLTIAKCDCLVVTCFHCSFHRSTARQGSQCRPISLGYYGDPSAIPRNVTASKLIAPWQRWVCRLSQGLIVLGCWCICTDSWLLRPVNFSY